MQLDHYLLISSILNLCNKARKDMNKSERRHLIHMIEEIFYEAEEEKKPKLRVVKDAKTEEER